MEVLKNVSLGFLSVCFLFSCGNKVNKEESKSTASSGANVQSPNVVFILSDDQSWTDYGFMGNENIETPRLDQFSSESLTFTQSYVPTPLCSPSLATIISYVLFDELTTTIIYALTICLPLPLFIYRSNKNFKK